MHGELYLVDSNVLIRWVQPEDSQFRVVEQAIHLLGKADATLCYTSQNLGELWNVLTRPANRNGYGLSPGDALIRAEQIRGSFCLLPDTPEVHVEWLHLLAAHGVCGVQVHDARLVAAMHIHGVKRILTFNTRDFVRFTDIEAIHPLDLSNQVPAE